MKRVIKPVTAGTGLTFENKAIFTPTDVVDILVKIEELQKCSIGLKPGEDGILILIVGNNEYELTDKTTMVFV